MQLEYISGVYKALVLFLFYRSTEFLHCAPNPPGWGEINLSHFCTEPRRGACDSPACQGSGVGPVVFLVPAWAPVSYVPHLVQPSLLEAALVILPQTSHMAAPLCSFRLPVPPPGSRIQGPAIQDLPVSSTSSFCILEASGNHIRTWNPCRSLLLSALPTSPSRQRKPEPAFPFLRNRARRK